MIYACYYYGEMDFGVVMESEGVEWCCSQSKLRYHLIRIQDSRKKGLYERRPSTGLIHYVQFV